MRIILFCRNSVYTLIGSENRTRKWNKKKLQKSINLDFVIFLCHYYCVSVCVCVGFSNFFFYCVPYSWEASDRESEFFHTKSSKEIEAFINGFHVQEKKRKNFFQGSSSFTILFLSIQIFRHKILYFVIRYKTNQKKKNYGSTSMMMTMMFVYLIPFFIAFYSVVWLFFFSHSWKCGTSVQKQSCNIHIHTHKPWTRNITGKQEKKLLETWQYVSRIW